jgi:hypothetical protein
MSKPTVAVQVTERELAYLSRLAGFPSYRFPHLQDKLAAAGKDMREAKRDNNRANKVARKEREANKPLPTQSPRVTVYCQ